MDLTTVADDEVVFHDGHDVRRHTDLSPDTSYELDGLSVRTLPRRGELLSTFCTVNDVHFGELECGVLEGFGDGPIYRTEPGDEPYPHLMNRCAVAEMAATDPAAVVVKGDLTARGSLVEYQDFLSVYRRQPFSAGREPHGRVAVRRAPGAPDREPGRRADPRRGRLSAARAHGLRHRVVGLRRGRGRARRDPSLTRATRRGYVAGLT
jgi:hypothetical protein